ncbi:hypothetical protein [Paracidovorax cattleyae]|uniref:hypothetical protein n=1 Tax=Paracidovorax cattleyae TaxID=80868 RepID=UPI00115FA708|nr:hypothetical protein [Paracidovorax cattleyae]
MKRFQACFCPGRPNWQALHCVHGLLGLLECRARQFSDRVCVPRHLQQRALVIKYLERFLHVR